MIKHACFSCFCVASPFAGSKNCALQDAKLNSVLHSNRAAVGLKMGEYLKAEWHFQNSRKFHRHWQPWLWHVVQHGLRWWMIADMQCLGCSERRRRFEWELKDFGQFVLKVQSINPLDPLQIQQKSQPQKPMGKTFETFWYEFFSLFSTDPGALGFVEFESLVSWRPSVRAVGPSGTRVVLLPRGTATRPQGEPGFC